MPEEKSQESKKPEKKRDWKQTRTIIGVGTVIILTLLFFLMPPPKIVAQSNAGNGDAGQDAGVHKPLPAFGLLKDGVQKYGRVVLSSKEETWWDMQPGEHIIVGCRDRVAFDEFVSHKFLKRVGGDPADPNKPRQDHAWDEGLTGSSMGFKILEGQGLAEKEFAYCKYRGAAPPPDWFKTACATERISNLKTR